LEVRYFEGEYFVRVFGKYQLVNTKYSSLSI